MPFENRAEAGRKLAVAVAAYKDQQPVVLALPRGGVIVAAEVAAVLAAPLDLILVRKVGVPFQPELAMGAVVDGGAAIVVRNEDVIRHAGIEEADFGAACRSEFAEIERRRLLYLGGRKRAEIAGCDRDRRWRRYRRNDPGRLACHAAAPSEAVGARGARGADGEPGRTASRGRSRDLPRTSRHVRSARLLLPRFPASHRQRSGRDAGTILAGASAAGGVKK